jgi:hypothetical protein
MSVFVFNFVMLLKWQSSIRIFRQIQQYSKSLAPFLILSSCGDLKLKNLKKTENLQQNILNIYFSQNCKNLPPEKSLAYTLSSWFFIFLFQFCFNVASHRILINGQVSPSPPPPPFTRTIPMSPCLQLSSTKTNFWVENVRENKCTFKHAWSPSLLSLVVSTGFLCCWDVFGVSLSL